MFLCEVNSYYGEASPFGEAPTDILHVLLYRFGVISMQFYMTRLCFPTQKPSNQKDLLMRTEG